MIERQFMFGEAVCTTVLSLTKNFLIACQKKRSKERADWYVDQIGTDTYLRMRSLRRLLGFYLGCRPKEIDFATNEYGKPFVVMPEGHDISFSLSHSHNMVLIAITRETPVGVDVEYLRNISDAHDIVNRFFSIEERKYLKSLSFSDFHDEFFACWTMKEAYLKGIGKGLSFPLDGFSVMSSNKQISDPRKRHHVSVCVYDWNITILLPGPGYSGALAVRGAMPKVEFFAIDPPSQFVTIK